MDQSFATSVDVLDRSLAVAMSRLDSTLGSFISMASQRELITLWQFTSLYMAVNRSEMNVPCGIAESKA